MSRGGEAPVPGRADSGAAGGGRGRALVITASNRASAGIYEDRGGPLLAAGLAALGFTVDGPLVVPDGDPVGRALRDGVAAGYEVILTTGGTGLSPTDRTPEQTRAVLDYEIPGIPEAIRAYGAAKVPTAVLSRGLAGVAGRTLMVNLPGSPGGVRDGLAVLERVLPHAVDQLRGADHGPGPEPVRDPATDPAPSPTAAPATARAPHSHPHPHPAPHPNPAPDPHPAAAHRDGTRPSGSTS